MNTIEEQQNTIGTLYREHVNPHIHEILSTLRLDVCYASGEGSWLIDDKGRRYLDFVCGYGAVGFGHSPPMVEAVLQRYVSKRSPALVQPSLLDSASRLASKLIAVAPAGLRYVWFTNSGAESVEAAIKACRAATRRPGVVYAQSSFHGKTLGALSATGAPKYQTPFYAPVADFHSVPYGDIAALEAVLRERKDSIACVILEPLQGEGGVNVPPAGYLKRVRELCNRYGVLFVLDEVQTGLGRLGTLFACETEEVSPDCLVLSKILGAGVVPIGCVLLSEQAFTYDYAMFHSSTYAGNALACEVGLAVVDFLTDPATSPLGNVAERSAQLCAGLNELAAKYPNVVRSVRGRGLLLGVELRCDRGRGGPGNVSLLGVMSEQGGLIAMVSSYLLNREGIRTAPTLTSAHVLRIEPALTVTEEECARFLAGLDRVLAHLARNDSAALLEHIAYDGQVVDGVPANTPMAEYRPLAEPMPSDTRLGFLVHLLDPRNLVDYDSSLARFDDDALRRVAEMSGKLCDPFVIGQTRVQTDQSSAYMEFICVPCLPDAMRALAPAEAEDLIGRAVALAASRGAKLVGLGGFTSIVTQGGANATGHGAPVTSGNTYTVLTAVAAAREAANLIGLEMSTARVAVVGAAGMIGGTLVDAFFGKVDRLVLVGNPERPTTNRRRLIQHIEATLEAGDPVFGEFFQRDARAQALYANGDYAKLAQAIVEGGVDVGVVCDTDVSAYLESADIVLCATSSTDYLIDVKRLKRGAIVLDLSRPHNVEREAIETRPDVLFIDGGVVAFPGLPELGVAAGTPPGHGLACMAETVILGLAGRFENISLGVRGERKTLRLIKDLGERFGFRLSGFRTHNRALTASDWQAFVEASGMSIATASRDDTPATEAHVRVPALHTPSAEEPGNLAVWLLHRHQAQRSDRIALINPETDEKITYRDLWHRVVCTARRFKEAGIDRGDTVSILSADTIDAAIAVLACWWSGVVASPMNPDLPLRDYQLMFGTVAPRKVLISAAYRRHEETLGGCGVSCGSLEDWTELRSAWLSEVSSAAPESVPRDAVAVYLFSSGSSGRPKAFAHTHNDFIEVNLNYVPTVGVKDDERIFSASRMFFAYGLLAVTFGLFGGGGAVLAPKPQRRSVLIDIIEKYRPNVFFTVPTVLKFICDQWPHRSVDLSSLRFCVSAGETLTDSLYETASRRFGVEIIDGIGCTEVLSTFISNRPGDSRPGSTGRVIPGFEVRLVNQTGETCRVGETGVLWVRGNTLTREAHGDTALTDKVFRDGWFNTNDLFRMDDERRFSYVGRANDVIKINGCWVAPTHIEEVLLNHPAVAECAVVPTHDEYGLIRPKAVVVTRSDVSVNKATLWEELRAHCKQHLGAHQYPHLFEEAAGNLPRTASGKLQRALLR